MVWKGRGNERLAPCLVVLIDEIDARAPGRDRRSDGSIGDRAHRARKSDHNPAPSSRGEMLVRALDVTDDEGNLHADLVYDRDDFDPDDFFEELRRRKDPRVKYCISDNRIFSSYWSGGIPPFVWRHYGGSNPHDRHGHISTRPEFDYDTSTWFSQEEDEMSKADIDWIKQELTNSRVREERAITLLHGVEEKLDNLEKDQIPESTMR